MSHIQIQPFHAFFRQNSVELSPVEAMSPQWLVWSLLSKESCILLQLLYLWRYALDSLAVPSLFIFIKSLELFESVKFQIFICQLHYGPSKPPHREPEFHPHRFVQFGSISFCRRSLVSTVWRRSRAGTYSRLSIVLVAWVVQQDFWIALTAW